MAVPALLVEQDDAGVVVARLNRPEARNALDTELISALTALARDLRLRPELRAVVLTGAEGFFSAGIDLKAPPPGDDSLIHSRLRQLAGPDLCRAWAEIEVPVIAAIEGFCVGGACALALACDFRVMGQGAMMRLPEVALGMNMSWGTVPRLNALIGPARAKRMLIDADPIPARTCLDWGLCDEAVTDGAALGWALDWARRIASRPPVAVRMAKLGVDAHAQALAAATSAMDRDQFLLTLGSRDLAEGMKAFLNKRDPRFTGN